MSFLMLALGGAVGATALLNRRPWLAWVAAVPFFLALWGLRGGNTEPFFWTATLLYASISVLPAFPPWKRSLFEVSEQGWIRSSFRAERRVLAADPQRDLPPAPALPAAAPAQPSPIAIAPIEPLTERPSVRPTDGEPLAPQRPAVLEEARRSNEALFAGGAWFEDELESLLCILDEPDDLAAPAARRPRPAPRDLAEVDAHQRPIAAAADGTSPDPAIESAVESIAEPIAEPVAESVAESAAESNAVPEAPLLPAAFELRDDELEHRAALAFAEQLEAAFAEAALAEPPAVEEPQTWSDLTQPAQADPPEATLVPELAELQAELTAKLDAIASEALEHEELEDLSPIVAALQAELAHGDPLLNASYDDDELEALPPIRVYELSEDMVQRSSATLDEFDPPSEPAPWPPAAFVGEFEPKPQPSRRAAAPQEPAAPAAQTPAPLAAEPESEPTASARLEAHEAPTAGPAPRLDEPLAASTIECGPAIGEQPYAGTTIEIGMPTAPAADEPTRLSEPQRAERIAPTTAVYADGWGTSADDARASAHEPEPVPQAALPHPARTWSKRLLGTPRIDALEGAHDEGSSEPEAATASASASETARAAELEDPIIEADRETAPSPATEPAEAATPLASSADPAPTQPTASSDVRATEPAASTAGPRNLFGDDLDDDVDRAPAALPRSEPRSEPTSGPPLGASLFDLFSTPTPERLATPAPEPAQEPAPAFGDTLEAVLGDAAEAESPAAPGAATATRVRRPAQRRAPRPRRLAPPAAGGPSVEAAPQPLEALERLRVSARRAARLDLVEGLFGARSRAEALALDADARRLVGQLRVDDLEAVLRSAPRDFTDLERLLGGLSRRRSAEGDSRDELRP